VAVKRGTGPRPKREERNEPPHPEPDARERAEGLERQDRQEREAAFFDELSKRAPSTDALEFRPGTVEGNLGAMFDWLGDLHGKRVLDLCCGTGTTSLLLAQSGAEEVVGCDVSDSSLDVARGRAAALDAAHRPSFVRQDLETTRAEWEGGFDVLFGSYALHHLDLRRCLPELASYLKPGGRSVFLETSARNPLLRWSRRWLTGRLGVPRYGTVDERPLTRDDLQTISCHLGGCQVINGDYAFLRILDRQILHYRSRVLSRACAAADTLLSRAYPSGSYHIVVACGPMADHGTPGSYGL
jgi:SAM-dependent methyltransferase